ncbi:hypothetical protein B0H14DRAFT_2637469 [Mycena olivaceomarginata]|nr:hypothetical protein B0H14DRAFT_2637469 [Mycena olivaceomarginata]
MSSFYILGFFPQNAPPSFIPHPRNVTASESSISTSLAQEDSAFNRSATNPYNYPMAQIDIQIKVFSALWKDQLQPAPSTRPDEQTSSSSSSETMPSTPATHFTTLAPTVATTAATSTPSGSSVSGTAAPTGQGPNLRSRRN